MTPRLSRLALLAAFVLTLGAAPQAANAVSGGPGEPVTGPMSDRSERPDPVLPGKMRGRAALDALADKTDEVAASNGLSEAKLTSLLIEDRSAWLSRDGRLFFVEAAPTDEQATGTPTSSAAVLAPAHPTSQTFSLHSRPGAVRKIFLDFDGATVSNTAWNSGTGAMTNASHIGYDTDGSPSTFSSAEHGWMQEVWRQVAETYAPFEVDVTTADPGSAGWIRSSSSDATFGSHVVVTSSATAVAEACNSTCLGTAFVGVFDQVNSTGYYQPAWVFAKNPNYDPMIVAQAAAHEVGHNLGLRHDGTSTANYYGGTSAWGPVMGSARMRATSQFSRGEYSDANNAEDDFAVMQGNSLALRSDDHPSSTASAELLAASPSYAVSGVIATRSDTDVFALTLDCTTELRVDATGIGAQSTLDASLQVLDAAGNTVGSSSPASTWAGSPPVSGGMDARVTIPAATGTYYLRVDGVGNGSAASGGWSDYGSLGQYRLTATGCGATSSTPPPAPTTAPAPVLTRPSAPRIYTAWSGRRGGAVTATARWAAPVSTGGTPISRYLVRVMKLDSSGRIARAYNSGYFSPTARAATLRLTRGRYRFSVIAFNKVGSSAWSGASNAVRAR